MLNKIIEVQNIKVNITNINDNDYICISDFTKIKDGKSTSDDIIRNWLRNRITLEFLGTWESIYNPNFNSVEFDGFKNQSGLHTFTLSVTEWCRKTNAIGIYSKRGKYGGTYAHKDIAFEFGMWISPKFKIYLIKEFERLKQEEQKELGWNAKRDLAKVNYRIHTDAIKNNLIPKELTSMQVNLVYAEEADVLNMALFGMTAKEWREKNPNKKGNIRDYASINELICLANLENTNSIFINEGMKQSDRLYKLNQIAISQMKILTKDNERNLLK